MIVFMDIDGTLADMRWRIEKAGTEPQKHNHKHKLWLRKIQNNKTLMQDQPIRAMQELCLSIHGGYCQLVYLTGRSEIYRKVTEEWLKQWGFPRARVLMRPRNNRKSNGKLKEGIIKNYTPVMGEGLTHYYDDVLVIDDDAHGDIEEACKRNGWTFLKARSGS